MFKMLSNNIAFYYTVTFLHSVNCFANGQRTDGGLSLFIRGISLGTSGMEKYPAYRTCNGLGICRTFIRIIPELGVPRVDTQRNCLRTRTGITKHCNTKHDRPSFVSIHGVLSLRWNFNYKLFNESHCVFHNARQILIYHFSFWRVFVDLLMKFQVIIVAHEINRDEMFRTFQEVI